MEPRSTKKVIVIVVIILVVGAIGAYVWLGGESGGGTESSSRVAPGPLVAGCGNNLCEEGETFNSCPTDCYNPKSSAPELAKLVLVPDDMPPPPQGTSWVTIYNQLLSNEESRIWPTLQNKGVLAIHNAVIRLSAPGDMSWDQWGHLEQFILAFPQNKILKIFDDATNGKVLAELIAQSREEVVLQELPDPVVGEKSKAYKFTGQNGPAQYSQYIIFFVKKGFLEYITFSGEKYEYQVFPLLARKAAEKIQ